MDKRKKPVKGNPLLHEKELTALSKKTRARAEAQAAEKAGEHQWQLAEQAIQAFIAKYPKHMELFLRDMERGRTKYSEALPEYKDLKKAQWRNTASFPVIYGRDPLTGEIREVDSLLPVLNRIIPGLTNKKSKNYAEFLERFPIFRPSDKSNTSEY